MPHPRRLLAALLPPLLIAAASAADPRWWRHDRPITTSGEPKASPDVDVLAVPGAAASYVFVVWQEETSPGDHDVLLDASFDGGCSYCGPRPWSADRIAETRPRIAVGLRAAGTVSIQVAHEAGGEVRVTGSAALPANGSPAQLCAALAALAPSTTTLSQGTGVDSRPRIAAATRAGALHFHAAWQSVQGAGSPSIHYASDTTGSGAGWGAAWVDVTSETGERGDLPDVAADGRAAAGSNTAATIVFADPAGAIRLLRSEDSGVTWTGPATGVSGDAGNTRPAIDASASGAGVPIWTGVVWQDRPSGSVTLDAAHWIMPATALPDFDPGPADVPAGGTGTDPAVAVAPPPPFDTAAPVWTVWTSDAAPGEIVARGGVLDPNDPAIRNLDRYPFRNVREAPADPALSTPIEPLTNCAWDDDWTGTPPMSAARCDALPRPGGAGAAEPAIADAPALAGAAPATFAVAFVDDRTGTPQVYVKLSDGQSPPVPAIDALRTGCRRLRQPEVFAEFDPLPACPAGPEAMERYLLYYGSRDSEGATATGPFVHRVEAAAAGLPAPATLAAPGLNPGETYAFALAAEDEARNLNPVNLDPRTDQNALDPAQQGDATAPSCEPVLSLVSCTPVADDCGGTSDGAYNPGDVVTVRVTLANGGDFAATAVTASPVAAGAAVVGGPVAVPSIAPGDSATVDVRLWLGPACPLDPTLELAGVESDAADPLGPIAHGTLACAAPLLTVTCAPTCSASPCSPASLVASTLLKGVKAGVTGARFEWTGDPLGLEHHLNQVPEPFLVPMARRPPAGSGAAACSPATPGCTLPGVVTAPPDRLYFQAYSACGPSGAEEGP